MPGCVVRRSAYIAPGVVLMPSFVNLGAYVDSGTMVDTWATVGSCAQIGKNCHISGGAGIGGVLEPLQAGPVIIEDNCFVGARSEVAEGVILREGTVLSMGVFLGASTKIVDRETGETFQGEVPAYWSWYRARCRRAREERRAEFRPSIAPSSSSAWTRRRARKPRSMNCCGIDVTTPTHRLARDLLRCPSVTPAEGGALALIESVLKGPASQSIASPSPSPARRRSKTSMPASAAPVRISSSPATPTSCRRARRRNGPSAVRRRDRPRHAVRPRRRRHEGCGRLRAGGERSSHLAARGGEVEGSISFLITGDEESIAVNGTVKLLKWAAERGERFDHCILGEPSNAAAVGDTIKVGRRGSLNGMLAITGKQGHVAYPERADNPVRGLVTLMGALMACRSTTAARFIASNLEFTSIDIGNPVVNLIPGEARARFNIRFNDCHSQASLETLIERARPRQRPARTLADRLGALERQSFVAQPGAFVDLVSAAIEEVTGRRRSYRPPAERRTRASSRTTAPCSNSAWSARPCIRSTSAPRSPISPR